MLLTKECGTQRPRVNGDSTPFHEIERHSFIQAKNRHASAIFGINGGHQRV